MYKIQQMNEQSQKSPPPEKVVLKNETEKHVQCTNSPPPKVEFLEDR
jgi:hypothetical protein